MAFSVGVHWGVPRRKRLSTLFLLSGRGRKGWESADVTFSKRKIVSSAGSATSSSISNSISYLYLDTQTEHIQPTGPPRRQIAMIPFRDITNLPVPSSQGQRISLGPSRSHPQSLPTSLVLPRNSTTPRSKRTVSI